MADTPISAAALKKLQTLYSQFAANSTDPRTRSREERLLWASFVCGRTVTSFSELTRDDAKRAIDALQKTLRKPSRSRMGQERARRHGIDGRRDGQEFTPWPQLAGKFDLEMIRSFYERLGWTPENFEMWLHSKRSPLGRRTDPTIRTVADANRVRWALKRMLQRAGRWTERPEERHAG